MSTEYSKQYKIILLGDSGVGKTSIINQYIKQEFTDELPATVGIEYQPKFVNYEGEKIKLGIWDTAGQEKFRTLTRQFYRNVDGVIMVYDITNLESFNNISGYWMNQLQENTNNSYQVIIIGNKSDLKETCDPSKLVTSEMGHEMARKYSSIFVEASAKSSDQVSNAFEEIIKRIHTDNKPAEQPSNVDLNTTEENNNSFCC